MTVQEVVQEVESEEGNRENNERILCVYIYTHVSFILCMNIYNIFL